LYYLLMFYVPSSLLFRFLADVKGSSSRLMKKYHLNIWIVLLVAFFVFFNILYFNHYITPPVYTGVRPNLQYLLYYGFFYGSGWLLFYFLHELPVLQNKGLLLLIAGIIISVVRFQFSAGLPYSVLVLTAASETFCLVYGMVGIFLRFFNRESNLWRYLSDSSYWVYLIHIFILSSVQILLLKVDMPGILKLITVLTVTVAVSMITYRYFVRFTFIGELLNGKRDKTKK
jgi:glucans biosynthesis protein C